MLLHVFKQPRALRERRRLHVDPASAQLSLSGGVLTTEAFLKCIMITNPALHGHRQPSMYSALYDPDDNIHAHNVRMQDDNYFDVLGKLIRTWVAQQVPPLSWHHKNVRKPLGFTDF